MWLPRAGLLRIIYPRRTVSMRRLRRIPIFVAAILLVLFSRPNTVGMSVGIPLIVLGEAIRIWAAGHLQKNEVLTVTGPYAYVKNPLYIGTILIATGFCILGDNIYLLAAATLAFCFHYIPYKKKVEGDRLRRIFGNQYEDYDRKVPEYVPRFTPYSDAKARWRFRVFWENSEAGIILINLLGIAAIMSRPHWGLGF